MCCRHLLVPDQAISWERVRCNNVQSGLVCLGLGQARCLCFPLPSAQAGSIITSWCSPSAKPEGSLHGYTRRQRLASPHSAHLHTYCRARGSQDRWLFSPLNHHRHLRFLNSQCASPKYSVSQPFQAAAVPVYLCRVSASRVSLRCLKARFFRRDAQSLPYKMSKFAPGTWCVGQMSWACRQLALISEPCGQLFHHDYSKSPMLWGSWE